MGEPIIFAGREGATGRSKSFEGSNINVGNQGIQFVGGVLVFVTHTCKANSASEGDISDSLRPEVLVEPGVNTDIFGSHLFDGELLDFLDGTGSTVFEADSMQPFVEVNCVFAGNNLAHG